MGVLAPMLAACGPSTEPAQQASPSVPFTEASVSAGEIADLRATAGLDPCPDTSTQSAAADSKLPDLTLPCLGDGPDVDLSALSGRPYVISVWAGWCGPCAKESTYLEEAYQQVGGTVGFLGIDMLEPMDYGLDSAARFGITYPSVWDEDAKTRPLLRYQGPPTTYFVDAGGRIAWTKQGAFESADEVRAAIEEHLGIDS